MSTQKEWFLTKELVSIGGLPNTSRGVLKKALTENWEKRQKNGVRGKVYEFHCASFPEAVLTELGLPIDEKNDDLKDIKQRLYQLQLPENQIKQYKNQLNITTLLKIQEVTNCDLNWLLTGKGEPFPNAQTVEPPHQTACNGLTDTRGNPIDSEDFVYIPYYNVELSAGNGSWVDSEYPLYSLAFRRDWLRTYVSTQIDKLSVVRVRGDSMQGVLEDGDTILVDHTKTTPYDGIYAIRIENEVFVKRVQRVLNKLHIISENPNYKPFEIDLTDEYQNFAIIGKVVWLGRPLTR